MLAGLGDFVTAGGAAVGFDIGAVHDFLDNDEHGVAADTAAVSREVSRKGMKL